MKIIFLYSFKNIGKDRVIKEREITESMEPNNCENCVVQLEQNDVIIKKNELGNLQFKIIITPKIYINKILIENMKKSVKFIFKPSKKLIYSTRDTDLYIVKQSANGTQTNLFNALNPNFINFIKLNKGVNQIKMTADEDITKAKITIYEEYKSI